MVNDLYIIRFAVCAKHATDEDMHIAFRIIQKHADNVIVEYRAQRSRRQSTSADSLEATTPKQPPPSTTIEQNACVPEETTNADTESKTSEIPYTLPRVKARVNKLQGKPKAL